VVSQSATRWVPRQLLIAALLVRALACPALADGLVSVPSAHGPVMMLYFRQPLGAGAARIYGLRLDQMALTPTRAAASSPLALSGPLATGPRDLLDLQFHAISDVRLEFGRRVTWSFDRREFGTTGNPPGLSIPLTTRALSSAVAARTALP